MLAESQVHNNVEDRKTMHCSDAVVNNMKFMVLSFIYWYIEDGHTAWYYIVQEQAVVASS